MIAHCPACGTHYRHDILATPMRGRCGRCDATIDLSRLRPYRLVAPLAGEGVAVAASVVVAEEAYAPSVAPAAPVASPAAEPLVATTAAPQASAWENEDPLPPIPEMATMEVDLPAMPLPVAGELTVPDLAGVPESRPAATPTAAEGRTTTWLLWVAAGAIAGTGISWTMGGTTLAGAVPGILAGAIAGWGWVRWMSPR